MNRPITIREKIDHLAEQGTESDLTINIMHQVANRLYIHEHTNSNIYYDLYETVIHYTDDWPQDEGWGSSDTTAVINKLLETNKAVRHYTNVRNPQSLPPHLRGLEPTGNLGAIKLRPATPSDGTCNFCTHPTGNTHVLSGHQLQIRICDNCLRTIQQYRGQ